MPLFVLRSITYADLQQREHVLEESGHLKQANSCGQSPLQHSYICLKANNIRKLGVYLAGIWPYCPGYIWQAMRFWSFLIPDRPSKNHPKIPTLKIQKQTQIFFWPVTSPDSQ